MPKPINANKAAIPKAPVTNFFMKRLGVHLIKLQLSNIRRNAPCLILAEQLRR
jgi:hypothetical protein